MINQRFLLKEKLGEGRSKVFSVIDSEFPEKKIAMKILPTEASEEEKLSFRQEYFTLRKIDHPNIIKAYDIGTILDIDDKDSDEIHTGSLYITIERFESVELNPHQSKFAEPVLIEIIKQICSALYYLHQSNYIYYDLKPENILISEVAETIHIKIIDLGLAEYILKDSEHKIKGTAEYIAPEILKNESHDHTIDFYSLGILLYRIIYRKFPFDTKTEIDVYKAQIENLFDFPSSDYSELIIGVVKKLLEKDPKKRYSNALEILTELGVEINNEITKDFLPARILSSRQDILNIVNTYLNDKKSNEIFTLRGFSGAGKSQVLSELHSIYTQSVYIEYSRRKAGIELIRFILHSLLYNESIYLNASNDDREEIKNLFSAQSFEIPDTLKALLTRVTEKLTVLLLIDDFNLFDDFARETISEFLPVLQINKIKIIIAETSEFEFATTKIFNVREVNLTPFTERQLTEYLDQGYNAYFPKQKLKKIILDYADLLPGSVMQFIKDALILGVMKYTAEQVKFDYDEKTDKLLKGSHEEIYRLRLSRLTVDELKVAQLISAFNISVEQIVLASILNKSSDDIERILSELQYKNIISPLTLSNTPNINSDGFKRFIYNTIQEKKKYHLIIASLIKRILPDFNLIEHARQYELAGEISKVVEIITKEIRAAENLSAYSYKRKLIEDLLLLDIKDDIRNSLYSELVKTIYKLSDYNKVLDVFTKVEQDNLDSELRSEINFIYGSSLIAVRQIERGIKILEEIDTVNQELKDKVLVEIAYAEFEQNKYKESEQLANSLIGKNNTSYEEKGRCYNLRGMIKVYAEEDLQGAISEFNKALDMYKTAKLPRRIAGVEVNLGNIYTLNSDFTNAEIHWENALKINSAVGNLEQEASILINYGVFYFFNLQFDKSINYLNRSKLIFSTIGQEENKALALINLSEVCILNCQYQNAFDNLTQAIQVLKSLHNKEELMNALYSIGKLGYYQKNYELLSHTIEEYDRYMSGRNYPDRYLLNYSILILFQRSLTKNNVDPDDFVEFESILSKLVEIGDKRGYGDFLINFVNYFISSNEETLNKITSLLFGEIVLEDSRNNWLLASYCEYFLGKISGSISDNRLLTPFEHFEKAYHLIENKEITELTWRVLFELSECYADRGHVKKAKKLIIYASELLNYISENIKNPDLRMKYLNDEEKQKVFDRLKSYNLPELTQ